MKPSRRERRKIRELKVDPALALQRIEDAFVEDIMSLSDEEILAEAAEDGIDVDALAKEWRERIAKLIAERDTPPPSPIPED